MTQPVTKKCRSVVRHLAVKHGVLGRDGSVSFDGAGHVQALVIQESVWEELGKPSYLTVTTRPGDRLNGY